MRKIWITFTAIIPIYLACGTPTQAQSSRLATCLSILSTSRPPNDIPLLQKVELSFGDPNVLKSLRSVRYTYTITISGGSPNVDGTLTRIYPNHLIMLTGAGASRSRLEATPTGAYIQVSGGTKSQLSDAMRDELLKTVQHDHFYVVQNIGSDNVRVTNAGIEHIGETKAAILRIDINGSRIVWYVDPSDGTVLRTTATVPSATGMIDQVVDYSDWRVCDGLKIPFQSTTTQGTQVSRQKLLTVELNPDVPGIAEVGPSWLQGERTDPLRGINYAEFSLVGKFLTPPNKAPNAPPVLIVHCIPVSDNHGHTNGKFKDGYVLVGGVTDTNVADNGNSFARVQFRLDDGKLQTESWGRSTDFSSIFFSHPTCALCGSGYDIFANLLYGHATYHKENTTPQVRKVVIGVNEFLGGEIVMQFDMPDATEVAESCGIIWHK
jgi:hypothetical protein